LASGFHGRAPLVFRNVKEEIKKEASVVNSKQPVAKLKEESIGMYLGQHH
jgi:hypothetical protein